MTDVVAQLERLLAETARSHHQATGGINDDWAIWYAEYLFDKLPPILGERLNRAELIYALMLLSKEQPHEAPDVPWPRYYAEYFAEHYAAG